MMTLKRSPRSSGARTVLSNSNNNNNNNNNNETNTAQHHIALLTIITMDL
jgi:hypothetical protein